MSADFFKNVVPEGAQQKTVASEMRNFANEMMSLMAKIQEYKINEMDLALKKKRLDFMENEEYVKGALAAQKLKIAVMQKQIADAEYEAQKRVSEAKAKQLFPVYLSKVLPLQSKIAAKIQNPDILQAYLDLQDMEQNDEEYLETQSLYTSIVPYIENAQNLYSPMDKIAAAKSVLLVDVELPIKKYESKKVNTTEPDISPVQQAVSQAGLPLMQRDKSSIASDETSHFETKKIPIENILRGALIGDNTGYIYAKKLKSLLSVYSNNEEKMKQKLYDIYKDDDKVNYLLEKFKKMEEPEFLTQEEKDNIPQNQHYYTDTITKSNVDINTIPNASIYQMPSGNQILIRKASQQ